MKITAHNILVLAVASLTEAHNVRVGDKVQEHSHVVTRTSPSEGSHLPPPRSGTHAPPRAGHKDEYLKARTTPRHGPGLGYGETCTDYSNPSEDCFSGLCVAIGGWNENPEDNYYECADCYTHEDCADHLDGPRCIYFPLDGDSSGAYAAPAKCSPAGEYGAPCTISEDCESDHCTWFGAGMSTGQCAECTSAIDCPEDRPRCISTTTGPATCEPLKELGQPCMIGEDCLSNVCFHPEPAYQSDNTALPQSVCGECNWDNPCADEERCVYDPDGLAYSECGPMRGYNETCMVPEDCVSGKCHSLLQPYDPDAIMHTMSVMVCAECMPYGSSTDCTEDMRCANDPGVAPYCAEKGLYGESCMIPEDCVSNLCVSVGTQGYYMQCADCTSSYDCTDSTRASYDSTKPRCVYDHVINEPGYCDAIGVLGEVCMESEDCESGICEHKPHAMKSFCSECLMDIDCEYGFVCFLVPTGGNTCAPLAENGDTCEYDSDCVSGICAALFEGLHKTCAGCETSSDCYEHPDGPVCIYDPNTQGPPVCGPLGETGDYCNESWDCVSTECIYAADSYDGICA